MVYCLNINSSYKFRYSVVVSQKGSEELFRLSLGKCEVTTSHGALVEAETDQQSSTGRGRWFGLDRVLVVDFIVGIIQARLLSIQDAWLSSKADEIQGFADRHDTKRFYDALKAVYGPPSIGSSPLLSADGQPCSKLLYGELCKCRRSVGWKRKHFKDNLKTSLKDFSISTETWETLATDRLTWCSHIQQSAKRAEEERTKMAEK
ncbi:hypothetical protein Pcinc_028428 [Petrolisthes cinctipes]|uniref:Uncharacterized protein n=1 Tax=Petrolisthes cinctipes TaxID=88211 RepID=A0AAE1K5E5_PETCI|nr:hypothetical protein Pcinc_028428 [Petrolisthes cinctipes]